MIVKAREGRETEGIRKDTRVSWMRVGTRRESKVHTQGASQKQSYLGRLVDLGFEERENQG